MENPNTANTINMKEIEDKIVPKLAFDALKNVKGLNDTTETEEKEKLFTVLYSFFGETLTLATELLDKCKIIEYYSDNDLRSVFKIITFKENFTVYENVNYCQCDAFTLQVLEQMSSLTCKHVLAVHLGKDKTVREKVTSSQLVNFLNEQFPLL